MGAIVDVGINVGEEPNEPGLKQQRDATAEKTRRRTQTTTHRQKM